MTLNDSMGLKRWQKVTLARGIWVGFALLVSFPVASFSLGYAILTQLIGTVVSLLSPRISDKILDVILGHERPKTMIQEPAEIAKKFAEEKQKRKSSRWIGSIPL